MQPTPRPSMTVSSVVWCLGLVLASVAAAGAQDAPIGDPVTTVMVEGIVTDAKGTGVPGLTVEVREHWEVLDFAKTGRDGRFTFPVELRPGEYLVVVLRNGKIAAEEFALLPPLENSRPLKLVVADERAPASRKTAPVVAASQQDDARQDDSKERDSKDDAPRSAPAEDAKTGGPEGKPR